MLVRLTAVQRGLGASITHLQLCAVVTSGTSRLLSTTAADEVNSEMAQFGIGPLASTAAQAAGGTASTAAAPAASSLDPELLSAVQEVNSELLTYFGTRPAQHDGAAVGEGAAATLVRQLSAPAAQAGSTGLNVGSRASTHTSSSSSSSSSSGANIGAGSGAAIAAGGAAVGGGGSQLTHVDASGKAAMVDVSHKADTVRTATAGARVLLGQRVFDLVASNQMAKGDVLTVAQLAGVMGAKHTAMLIPLCHNILLSRVHVTLRLDPAAAAVDISASATTKGPTGVEMEALTAASVAALTVYDMCKAASKGVVITDVRLLSKTGGKSGDWVEKECGGGGSAASRQPKAG